MGTHFLLRQSFHFVLASSGRLRLKNVCVSCNRMSVFFVVAVIFVFLFFFLFSFFFVCFKIPGYKISDQFRKEIICPSYYITLLKRHILYCVLDFL